MTAEKPGKWEKYAGVLGLPYDALVDQPPTFGFSTREKDVGRIRTVPGTKEIACGSRSSDGCHIQFVLAENHPYGEGNESDGAEVLGRSSTSEGFWDRTFKSARGIGFLQLPPELRIVVCDSNAMMLRCFAVKEGSEGGEIGDRFEKRWTHGKKGTSGPGEGTLYYPQGLATGLSKSRGEEIVLVSDGANHRVKLLSGSTGRVLGEKSMRNGDANTLDTWPWDCAVDQDGDRGLIVLQATQSVLVSLADFSELAKIDIHGTNSCGAFFDGAGSLLWHNGNDAKISVYSPTLKLIGEMDLTEVSRDGDGPTKVTGVEHDVVNQRLIVSFSVGRVLVWQAGSMVKSAGKKS